MAGRLDRLQPSARLDRVSREVCPRLGPGAEERLAARLAAGVRAMLDCSWRGARAAQRPPAGATRIMLEKKRKGDGVRGLGNPASKPRCSNGRRTSGGSQKSNKGGKKKMLVPSTRSLY